MTNDKRRFDSAGTRVATDEPEVSYRIRPRHRWVLIRKLMDQEKISEAGVIQPGAEHFMMEGAKSSRGMVVAAGDGVDLAPGDIVVFTNFPIALRDLEAFTGDSELQLVRDEEVYAVVEKCE